MSILIKKCSECGANVPVTEGTEPAYCPSCGAPLSADGPGPEDAYPYAEDAPYGQAGSDEADDVYPYSESAAYMGDSDSDDDAYPYSENAASQYDPDSGDSDYPYGEDTGTDYSDDGEYPYSEGALSSTEPVPDDDVYPYSEGAVSSLDSDSDDAYPYSEQSSGYSSDTLSSSYENDTLGNYGSDTLGSYTGSSPDQNYGNDSPNSFSGDTLGSYGSDTLNSSIDGDLPPDESVYSGSLNNSYGSDVSGNYGGDTLGGQFGAAGAFSESSPSAADLSADTAAEGNDLSSDSVTSSAGFSADSTTPVAGLSEGSAGGSESLSAAPAPQPSEPASVQESPPASGSAPAKTPPPPQEEEPAAPAAIPHFSSSVKLSHYLGLTGTSGDAEPTTYMSTASSTLLAFLKFLGAAAAALAIVLSVSLLMPLLSSFLQNSAQTETISGFTNQIIGAYEAQFPGLGAFIHSIPGVDSMISMVPDGLKLAQPILAVFAFIVCAFLLLDVIEGLSAILLRFSGKGASAIRLTHIIHMGVGILLFVLTLVLYVLGSLGITNSQNIVPEQLKELTAGLPVTVLATIVIAVIALGRLLEIIYHKDVAQAMKIIRHDLSTGVRPDTKKSLLTIISIFYAFLWAMAGAAIVVSVLGVGPTIFTTQGFIENLAGNQIVSIVILLIIPVYKLLKSIMVAISYHNLMS